MEVPNTDLGDMRKACENSNGNVDSVCPGNPRATGPGSIKEQTGRGSVMWGRGAWGRAPFAGRSLWETMLGSMAGTPSGAPGPLSQHVQGFDPHLGKPLPPLRWLQAPSSYPFTPALQTGKGAGPCSRPDLGAPPASCPMWMSRCRPGRAVGPSSRTWPGGC